MSIDDDGVTQLAGDSDSYLKERFKLVVGIWRRISETPVDLRGKEMLRDNPYQANATTLSDLERYVIRSLHKSRFVNQRINDEIGQDTEQFGEAHFILPLNYRGRSTNEYFTPPGMDAKQGTWMGRRLRFSGLDRTQSIKNDNAFLR